MPPSHPTSVAVPFRTARGAVIVLVLVTVLVAAMLLTRFIERTTTELLVEARAAQADRLRADAGSALEVTLAVLADFRAVDGGLHAPAQGWGDPLGWAGYAPRAGVNVDVALEDESGKPSLPRLDAPALQDLGEELGLRPNDAERVADALLTWTQPEHVAATLETDPRNYERAAPPHHPPLRPLRSFDELASVAVARDLFYDQDGQPTELWTKFADSVSLYSFPTSNLNAGQGLPLALAGLDPAQSRQVADYLAGRGVRPAGAPSYFRGPGDVTALLGANVAVAGLGAEVSCLRIRVTVREGAAAFRLTAVVAPPGGATVPAAARAEPADQTDAEPPPPARPLYYPFTILSLQEEMTPEAGAKGNA